MALTPVFPVSCTKSQSQTVAYKRTAPQRRFFFACRLGLGHVCCAGARAATSPSTGSSCRWLCPSQNIEWLHVGVVGKIRELRKGVRLVLFCLAAALLLLSLSGYPPDVAAYSATGRETPGTIKAQRRHRTYCGVFFRQQSGFMAAVRGRLSGLPVTLIAGSHTTHGCHPRF